MKILQVKNLCKSFGENKVLRNLDFTLNQGEFVSVIGPSGIGKTTFLKIIAGIEQAEAGLVQNKSNKINPVVMVMQDYALFPHMTVANNTGFGLKSKGISKKERMKKVMQILDWFGIQDKANEYPANISAGQKQRTAIARALIVEPELLLLDEPFSNLDINLKEETAELIRNTQEQFGTSTIMVTHDQDAAIAVSDRIAVMLDGKFSQIESPLNLYISPADKKTEQFLSIRSSVNNEKISSIK